MEQKRHKKTRRGCRGVESQHRRDALKRVQYRQRSQESAHLSMVRCLQDRRQELARQAERASKAVRKQDGVTERLSQTQKDLAVATLRLDGVSAQLRDARHELAEKEDRLAEAEQQLFAVETRLQRTQAWLEAVLRDNEQKDLLIEELKYEMAMLLEEDRASKEDHQLEWIQAKLELMQQLSEVKQVAKERLRENTVLRRVIGKQLQADVKVLGTPMQGDDLPRMPDGSINQEANLEEWMQITSDTIFVWNRDSAEEERIGGEKGQVAFAVFHRPEEVMDHLPTFLGIFDHIDRFRYRLKRHTIKEHGKVWGLGIRAGFDKDRSYGAYAVPPEGKLSGRERSRFPENVAIEGLGAQAAEILECVFKRRVPCEMAERHGIVLCDDVPTMGESESTTGMIATEGYRVDRHVDTDLGVAYGVWFEVHSPECRQETCCERWAFLFPEYRIAVPISNGTCIIWRGKQVAHLTILKVSANACQGHRALSLVTQIKKVLIDRVRSHNRRHFQHEI